MEVIEHDFNALNLKYNYIKNLKENILKLYMKAFSKDIVKDINMKLVELIGEDSGLEYKENEFEENVLYLTVDSFKGILSDEELIVLQELYFTDSQYQSIIKISESKELIFEGINKNISYDFKYGELMKISGIKEVIENIKDGIDSKIREKLDLLMTEEQICELNDYINKVEYKKTYHELNDENLKELIGMLWNLEYKKGYNRGDGEVIKPVVIYEDRALLNENYYNINHFKDVFMYRNAVRYGVFNYNDFIDFTIHPDLNVTSFDAKIYREFKDDAWVTEKSDEPFLRESNNGVWIVGLGFRKDYSDLSRLEKDVFSVKLRQEVMLSESDKDADVIGIDWEYEEEVIYYQYEFNIYIDNELIGLVNDYDEEIELLTFNDVVFNQNKFINLLSGFSEVSDRLREDLKYKVKELVLSIILYKEELDRMELGFIFD